MARIPDTVKERIRLLYESGMEISDISKETGVNFNEVYINTVFADGLKKKEDRIRFLYESGMSVMGISKETGVDYNKVYRKTRLLDFVKEKGYKSVKEYQKAYRADLAKRKSYNSLTEYQEDLAKKQGYNSYKEYRKDLAEKKADYPKKKALAILIEGRLSDIDKSKQWLAEEIGVSRQMIYNYCHGLSLPSKEKAQKIANKLNMDYDTIDSLLHFEDS